LSVAAQQLFDLKAAKPGFGAFASRGPGKPRRTIWPMAPSIPRSRSRIFDSVRSEMVRPEARRTVRGRVTPVGSDKAA
jgi:hypothetical protein